MTTVAHVDDKDGNRPYAGRKLFYETQQPLEPSPDPPAMKRENAFSDDDSRTNATVNYDREPSAAETLRVSDYVTGHMVKEDCAAKDEHIKQHGVPVFASQEMRRQYFISTEVDEIIRRTALKELDGRSVLRLYISYAEEFINKLKARIIMIEIEEETQRMQIKKEKETTTAAAAASS